MGLAGASSSALRFVAVAQVEAELRGICPRLKQSAIIGVDDSRRDLMMVIGDS